MPAGWGPRPQLNVLRSVVVSDAMDVVHRLAIHEVAPKKTLCDENVFKNVWTSSSAGMTGGT
jgi:hypothetical protein